MNTKLILILLIVALVLFVAHKILSKFKMPKVGAMCLISGGVKTGKTTFGVALAIDKYKRTLRSWKIKSFLCDILNREKPEKPLLYSNIPLKVPYVPITKDLLTRKKRFRFGSVVYVCEASLVADSQLIKDMDLNNNLLLFNKLIGHSLHSGHSALIYDTQTIADVHYSVKRCLSEYFYVHHLVKWIPGILIAYIREERYSEDGSVISTYDKDVEETLKKVIIKKSTWKKFDSCCYSIMTDNLPCEDKIVEVDDLKAKDIVSFRDWSKYINSDEGKVEYKKIEYNTLEYNNDEKKND